MLVLIISCGNIRLRCFWFKIQVLKFPFQFLPLEWLWKKINFQTVVADLLKYYESFRFFSSFVSLYQEFFLILYRDINVWNNIRKKKRKIGDIFRSLFSISSTAIRVLYLSCPFIWEKRFYSRTIYWMWHFFNSISLLIVSKIISRRAVFQNCYFSFLCDPLLPLKFFFHKGTFIWPLCFDFFGEHTSSALRRI